MEKISSTNKSVMKAKLYLCCLLTAFVPTSWSAGTTEPSQAAMKMPTFQKLADVKWQKILPDLGADSPEICFLHVDPTTHATQLLIRTPSAIHVPSIGILQTKRTCLSRYAAKFECEGKSAELGPGSFNFMPAKMVHEAWLPAGCLTFITVDGAWDVNWVEGPPTAADVTK